MYQTAIKDGLAKLNKYYSRFDEKPAYILALRKSMYESITNLSDVNTQSYTHTSNWLTLKWLGGV